MTKERKNGTIFSRHMFGLLRTFTNPSRIYSILEVKAVDVDLVTTWSSRLGHHYVSCLYVFLSMLQGYRIYANRKQFSVQLPVKKRMILPKQDQHIDKMTFELLL